MLSHVANGLTYKDMAREEMIAWDTARNTVAQAVKKSGANNPSHLACLLLIAGALRYNRGKFEPVAK